MCSSGLLHEVLNFRTWTWTRSNVDDNELELADSDLAINGLDTRLNDPIAGAVWVPEVAEQLRKSVFVKSKMANSVQIFKTYHDYSLPGPRDTDDIFGGHEIKGHGIKGQGHATTTMEIL